MCFDLFCCRLWFDSILLLWLFHPVFECVIVFAFTKIKLPWLFRCFSSTVGTSRMIMTATVVPCSTTPFICLWPMSPEFGSTKGNLCCKTVLKLNKYVCTDKLLIISSLLSCCYYYNANCVNGEFFSILGFVEIKSISSLGTWVTVYCFARRGLLLPCETFTSVFFFTL